jgi:hypothetical protein
VELAGKGGGCKRIVVVRERQVMLDANLAELYGV